MQSKFKFKLEKNKAISKKRKQTYRMNYQPSKYYIRDKVCNLIRKQFET